MEPLTQSEIAELIRRLKSGEALPDEYKDRLFVDSEHPRLTWKGKRIQDTPAASCYDGRFFTNGEPASKWRNLLIHGGCANVLSALKRTDLQQQIQEAGGIKLIYIDPPFDVGTHFKMTRQIGATRKKSKFETVAYRDAWADHSTELLNILYTTLHHLHEILADDGSLYVHCDWRLSGQLRLMLDEIFGGSKHRNEICWSYNSRTMTSRWFARKHDTIFLYGKTDKPIFNADVVRIPHKPESQIQYNQKDDNGRLYKQQSNGKRSYLNPLGQPCPDVWEIQLLGSRTPERVGYPTQKPRALLERIIKASSNEGDVVADFFCGSGVLAETATQLNRKWICADIGPLAIQTTSRRLLYPLAPLKQSAFEIQTCRSNQQQYKEEQVLLQYGARLVAGQGRKDDRLVVVILSRCPVSLSAVKAAIKNSSVGQGMDILAHGFTFKCLEWIKENHKSNDIVPKIIPEHLLRIQGHGTVFFMHAVLPKYEVVKHDDGLHLVLSGLHVFSDKTPRPETRSPLYVKNGCLYEYKNKSGTHKRLTENWQDWIEGWSIGHKTTQMSTNKVLWHDFRNVPDRHLTLSSAKIEPPEGAIVEITISDIFGINHTDTLSFDI